MAASRSATCIPPRTGLFARGLLLRMVQDVIIHEIGLFGWVGASGAPVFLASALLPRDHMSKPSRLPISIYLVSWIYG
jgi:hypothetical protein